MSDVDYPVTDQFVGRAALELPERETERILRETGHGVLALAHESRSYALPASAGYDGESTLYFQFGFAPSSVKRQFLERTERASFVVYDVEAPEWESVVVNGPVRPVPDDELGAAHATHEDNAWVPMNAFEKPLSDVEFGFYALDAETVQGYGTRAMDEDEQPADDG